MFGHTFGTATTARPVNLLRIEEQLSEAHLRLSGVIILAISLVPDKFCSESNNQTTLYHGASL